MSVYIILGKYIPSILTSLQNFMDFPSNIQYVMKEKTNSLSSCKTKLKQGQKKINFSSLSKHFFTHCPVYQYWKQNDWQFHKSSVLFQEDWGYNVLVVFTYLVFSFNVCSHICARRAKRPIIFSKINQHSANMRSFHLTPIQLASTFFLNEEIFS